MFIEEEETFLPSFVVLGWWEGNRSRELGGFFVPEDEEASGRSTLSRSDISLAFDIMSKVWQIRKLWPPDQILFGSFV